VLERPDAATAAALARLYDLDLLEDPGDLVLYRALADRADGAVLELAAGTGRITVPLAAAGHSVTAVDNDAAMLDRARRRANADGVGDRIEFLEADMVDVRLDGAGRHRLAFIALNSIMVLPTRDGQRAAFRTLAAHLAPGGLAVVDAWLPDGDDLARFDGRVILEWPRTDPESGAVVTKTGSAQHDAATGTVTLTAVYEVGRQGESPVRWVRRDRLRLISPDEMTAFAEDAGLDVEILAGGYDLSPLGPGSERAVLVAVRR